MLTSILKYFSFADYMVDFFSDYFVGRLIQYSWSLFLFNTYGTDVSIE